MEIETNYVAKDGKKFKSPEEATAYEAELARKAEERYQQYMKNSYSCKRLLSEHSMTEHGFWEATGESDDPGPGGGYSPKLGIYEGQLGDVIRHVTAMKGFWSWGAGGSITKVNVTKV